MQPVPTSESCTTCTVLILLVVAVVVVLVLVLIFVLVFVVVLVASVPLVTFLTRCPACRWARLTIPSKKTPHRGGRSVWRGSLRLR